MFDLIHSLKPLHNNDRIFVLWLLGNQCTYKCSYCPDMFHDGTFPYQSYDNVLKTYALLPKSHVMFSGGEPTFHPDFEKIVKAKPDHVQVSVISNASRPIAFWERTLPDLHRVILTFHSEFARLERFIDTALLCGSKLQRVNLTMLPSKWNECIKAYETFQNRGISVAPKPLVKDFGARSMSLIDNYTSAQKEWINANQEKTNKYIGLYNKGGELIRATNPSSMLSADETNFNGWSCYTPTKFLNIDFGGDIYDTSCMQRNKIGSVSDGFQMTTQPVICKQNFCWCHSDIEPLKIKND
jgi:hypothetical protein